MLVPAIRLRTIASIALGSVLAAPAVTGAEPARRPGNINAREHRQSARIRDGVRDGTTDRRELDRLRGDEAAIRAEERVYRRSGGGLNHVERRDLERDLNRTSREIYRAKHNGR
jgi:hypothetical protein